jgi:hypothetical protein
MIIVYWLIFSITAGVFGRWGGASTQEFSWAETKWRDIGIPVLFIGMSVLFHFLTWMTIVSALLLWGALACSCKSKGTDSTSLARAFQALLMAASILPSAWSIHHLVGYAFYCVALVSGYLYFRTFDRDKFGISSVWWQEGFGYGCVIFFSPLIFLIKR